MAAVIFKAENATFAYKQGNNVFRDISFEIRSGDIVSVLGANGAGKTTLLKYMMGFYRSGEGRVFIDGESIYSMSEKKLWQKIAYVPQSRGNSSSLDVRNMILLGTANRVGVFSSPDDGEKKFCHGIAERLGITHLLDKKYNEISGGEMKMVLIARALAGKPEILILDEPESSLDFKNQLIVLDTVTSLAKEEGIACVFSTHYPDHALARSDKSLLLIGEEAIFGLTEDIVTEENIRRAFGVEAVIDRICDGEEKYSVVVPTRISR